ncbi:MAG: Secreted trypsin-like serine protease [Phormidesmis priestleyi Ana]|uniref:Secreted trypsin-like serine protease n=1 Tax=Phormidesmis priestleyi Ana TaxID=1666911 RepID=A0A0P7Z437_9CYAN|nr:MAG: Secreted trypsin-like serine protease [Phormidesmis priestleyi Ana]
MCEASPPLFHDAALPIHSIALAMIIRHDIDPSLYLAEPTQFPAVVVVDRSQEEIQIAYDQIDELLKPSLIPTAQTPEYRDRCDGMGMLIAPHWILTAAQVATEISLETKIEFNHIAYSIQQIVLHPHFLNDSLEYNLEYSLEKDIAEHDIALIRLHQPVEEVAPLPLFNQTNEQGQVMTFVGKGDFGHGLIGPDQIDGKLRMATNRVESVDEQWLVFKFDAPPEGTEREGIAGPGDSGGPALVNVEGGWAIAGIRSGQLSRLPSGKNMGEGHYGVWEYYTRVSQYLDWINAVVS